MLREEIYRAEREARHARRAMKAVDMEMKTFQFSGEIHMLFWGGAGRAGGGGSWKKKAGGSGRAALLRRTARRAAFAAAAEMARCRADTARGERARART